MSLAKIGPVVVDFHGDPKFSFGVKPTQMRLMSVAISGIFTWPVASQLRELLDNDDARTTVRGQTGVLDIVWFTDDLLAPMRGTYLLTDHNFSPEQRDSLNGLVPMTISGLRVGSPDLRVVRSARTLGLAGVTARSLVAHPFPGVDGAFSKPLGGTRYSLEYDPLPHDSARVTAPAASMEVYVGAVASTTDELAAVCPFVIEDL